MDEKELQTGASEQLNLYLLLGRLLFQNGASSTRIIDSLTKLRKYLGDTDVNVMLAYEALTVTRETNAGLETKVGRRRSAAVLNVRVLMGIGTLLRALKNSNASVETIRVALEDLTDNKHNWPFWMQNIALALAAAGFGLLNGSDWWALLAVMPAALLIGGLRHFFTVRKFHTHASLLLSTIIGTMICGCMLKIIPTQTSLVAIIAILLPLVPGVFVFIDFSKEEDVNKYRYCVKNKDRMCTNQITITSVGPSAAQINPAKPQYRLLQYRCNH